MKSNKNLNSDLTSSAAVTSDRATIDATSPSVGLDSLFESSLVELPELLESEHQTSQRVSRFPIPKPPPLPAPINTSRYFRSNLVTSLPSAHLPVSACVSTSTSDDSDDTHRTLVTSSVNLEHPHLSNLSHHCSSQSTNECHRNNCEECTRFHAKHHQNPTTSRHHRVHQKASAISTSAATNNAGKSHSKGLTRTPSSVQPNPRALAGFRPYPPQWYFLLGADSNKFRKHKHTYYHKNCKACKAIVRQSFEQYYLGQTPATSAPSASYPIHERIESSAVSESSSTAPLSFGECTTTDGAPHHSSSSSSPQPYTMSPPNSTSSPMPPFFMVPRRRASCGHSCLKYTILFYCSVAVILAICAICYLTKMFGYLDPSVSFPVVAASSTLQGATNHHNHIPNLMGTNFTTNDGGANSTNDAGWSATMNNETHSSRIIEMLRAEVVGIVIASSVMMVFFLGLIGGFLESVLCLRIFGAVLSYLFLLTFGAALYIVILLVISTVQSKLILSAISCAGVAITIHAAIAIAPFAFADLISQEREDEMKELNNTSYMKFPSVRFLPMMSGNGLTKRGASYFSLPFRASVRASKRFLNRNNGAKPPTHHRSSNHNHQQHSQQQQQQQQQRPSPTESPNNIVFSTHHNHQDNSSSEGLIPAQSAIRFRDNWI